MSQVTEQSVRFQTALASIKLIQASAVLDLTEDDFDFLTSNKVWIATDRSRARRCVEACVYGTLDFVGYPRFPAPVEFIAADRKSGSAGMPRPISYAVFCLKKKKNDSEQLRQQPRGGVHVSPCGAGERSSNHRRMCQSLLDRGSAQVAIQLGQRPHAAAIGVY